MTDKIYNIPAGCAFAEVLAGHFLREYHGRELELTDVLFLLPNRRAVKALKDAFVRLQGLAPTLLPQMLPIGDVEEDELFLTGFDSLPLWQRWHRLSAGRRGCCCSPKSLWPNR